MASSNISVLCHYHYDPLDRLASVTAQAQAPIRHFYQKKRLATQIQGAISFSLVNAQDTLLAQLELQGPLLERTLFSTDMGRSVLVTLGTKQNRACVYMPYGFRTPLPGLPGLPGFNGETPDSVTGHYLLGNGLRAFNPVLMRFNSPDSQSPFGKGGLNSYAYCADDPINNVDPTGRFLSKLFALAKGVSTASSIVAVPDVGKSSLVKASIHFIEETVRTTFQALSRNRGPAQPMSSIRKSLDDALHGLSEDPFTIKLQAVNRNFASHGVNGLSRKHAVQYAKLAQQVHSGEISNTFAHMSSARLWATNFRRNGQPSDLVGMTFNIAGGLLSGVADHSDRAKGLTLRRGSNI